MSNDVLLFVIYVILDLDVVFDKLEKEIEIQLAQLIDIVKNGPKYEHEKVCHKNYIGNSFEN